MAFAGSAKMSAAGSLEKIIRSGEICQIGGPHHMRQAGTWCLEPVDGGSDMRWQSRIWLDIVTCCKLLIRMGYYYCYESVNSAEV